MARLKQGDKYEEENVEYEGDKNKDSGNKESKDARKQKLIVAIISGVILLIVIIVIVVTVSSNSDNKNKNKIDLESLSEEDPDFDPFGDVGEFEETDIMSEFESGFSYTEEERRKLFLMGVSTEEIEYSSLDGIPFSEIEERILIERENFLKGMHEDLAAQSPDEIKSLRDKTWLGGETRNMNMSKEYYPEILKRVENCDYMKLPPKGEQLYIRISLDNGNYAFMNVSPRQYLNLSSSGNIVIEISYVRYEDGEEFIIGLVERLV